MVLTQQTKQQPSENEVNQIVLSVLQNPEAQASKQIMKAYEEYKKQQLPTTTRMDKLGAKLAYYKKLKGSCPEGLEMIFFKSGGKMDCKCQDKMQKGGDIKKKSNAVSDFKNNRKKTLTDSKQLPKKACGSKLKKKK